MNPNWPRWIEASFAKWFTDALFTNPPSNKISVLIEGEDRVKVQGKSDYCELRIDGPFGRQQSPLDWEIAVEVNVLISSIKDDVDAYKIHRNNGLVAAAFPTTISIYRYGDGPGDDQGFEGCLILRSDKGNALVVSNFGTVPDIRLMQSSIEGHYKGQFTN